ncbi:hypothetical protein Syn6312_1265 [Synechococcus sp. PCC 6312]|nr:hypothetical protein Syn6312_1265 [Synechococcus sp. PCC 6312]
MVINNFAKSKMDNEMPLNQHLKNSRKVFEEVALNTSLFKFDRQEANER